MKRLTLAGFQAITDKWLGSWFAWEFGLKRLVIATLFLGTFAGLNMRTVGPPLIDVSVGYYWGRPLPFMSEDGGLQLRLTEEEFIWTSIDQRKEFDRARLRESGKEYRMPVEAPYSHGLPLTHRTYLLLKPDPTPEGYIVYRISQSTLILCGIINLLFMLTVLALILCLQIPRRKALAPN